ncbi:MAG: SagB/ThcOx family dehydrogenase [bacterium]
MISSTPFCAPEAGLSLLFLLMLGTAACPSPGGQERSEVVDLPEPQNAGEVSVEQAIQERRSIRTYGSSPLGLEEAGQLVWSAQGVTDPEGLRAAPSAGATYPLELYLVAGGVEGLEAGVYRYLPRDHALERTRKGDVRTALARAALSQEWMSDAPVSLVITGVLQRTAQRYGDRARRYVHIEAGCAAENVCLQATALGLGTVIVGAFRDEEVKEVLGLPEDHEPLCIMPVGKR